VILLVELVQVPLSYYLLHGATTDLNARTQTVSASNYLLSFLSNIVLSGILVSVVGQAVLGRPMTAGGSWQATRPLLWRLVGSAFLIFFIIVLILAVGALPGLAIALAGATDAG
jgi:hypothetical protein